MSRPESIDRARRAGFSLIELIMSVLVLAFGVVGLATTTLFITRELTIAEVTTIRATATRSVMERLRATPYGSIASGGDTIGPMVVSWTVTATTPQTTTLDIVTLGPGRVSASASGSAPMLSGSVADTLLFKVLKP
jgi:prepilin-type N-terminal cleavage/methylation domain-containing protein